MWSLRDLRFDDAIPGNEVYVADERGELALEPKLTALARARAAGLHLIAQWPTQSGIATCQIRPLRLPLEWEHSTHHVAPGSVPDYDPELWFLAACGERDFLVGNGNTFLGRMAAWCPTTGKQYNVSLGEITQMSPAARYWITGFLHGAQPRPPRDEDGDTSHDDLAAWLGASARFRRTGAWFGRWRTCLTCGRVLWPDTANEHCETHPAPQ